MTKHVILVPCQLFQNHSEPKLGTENTPQWMKIPNLASSYHWGRGLESRLSHEGVYCVTFSKLVTVKISVLLEVCEDTASTVSITDQHNQVELILGCVLLLTIMQNRYFTHCLDDKGQSSVSISALSFYWPLITKLISWVLISVHSKDYFSLSDNLSLHHIMYIILRCWNQSSEKFYININLFIYIYKTLVCDRFLKLQCVGICYFSHTCHLNHFTRQAW